MDTLTSNKGFTLLETVISIMLVMLLINGLLLVWQFTEAQSRELESLAQAKIALETAYEVTLRSLRQFAVPDVNVAADGQSIQFRDHEGLTWSFFQEATDFKKVSGNVEEVLLAGTCAEVSFELVGRNVTFLLKTITTSPQPDLTVQGTVFLRNWSEMP